MKKLLIIVLIFLIFNSCATKRVLDESKRTEMYVMVYDYENKGLQNVLIYIDNKLIGKTDIYGRYLLDLKKQKEYTIRIQKNEYEIVEREFFYNAMYVLYFQIGNATQLLQLAESALDESDFEEVLDLLERSLKLDTSRIDAYFLKAVVKYKMGHYDEALDLLEKIELSANNKNTINEFKQQINNLRGVEK